MDNPKQDNAASGQEVGLRINVYSFHFLILCQFQGI